MMFDKNNPKVSVIIPFYSGVMWLEEAVQSVLDQTYSNLEILVINDGSKEDVSRFLAKYGDKITYVYQQNSGPGAARNRAINIATGKYIAFLDSDDLWTKEKTRLQIELMEQTNAMWSHTNYINFIDGVSESKKYSTLKFKGDLSKIALIGVPLQTPALIIRKEYFDMNPDACFGEHMRYGQDTYLYTQIAWNYPIAHLDQYVTLVRIRRGEKGMVAAFRARVRFRVRRQMWDLIKNDKREYVLGRHINFIVKLTYSYYSFWDKIITHAEGKSGIKGFRYEFTCRVLCVPVYMLERIYLKFMIK